MTTAPAPDHDVPAPLAARMQTTLARVGAGAGADADRLADAAFAALRAALAFDGARAAAFELLTADALLTAACAGTVDGTLSPALAPMRFHALLEEE